MMPFPYMNVGPAILVSFGGMISMDAKPSSMPKPFAKTLPKDAFLKLPFGEATPWSKCINKLYTFLICSPHKCPVLVFLKLVAHKRW